MITVLFCEEAIGQIDQRKIAVRLVEMYNRANKLRRSPECLMIADTMLQEAKRLNDKQAQCLALSIPVSYYFTGDKRSEENNRAMLNAVNNLRNAAKDAGFEQQYYFAESTYVSFLLNRQKHQEALARAQKLMAEAKHTNSKYGTYVSYNMMGNIYVSRHENLLGVNNYVEAYNYAKEHLKNLQLYSICYTIARTYMWLGDYEKAYEYVNQALKLDKNKTQTDRIRIMLCMTYFFQGKKSEFFETYKAITSSKNGGYRNNQFWLPVEIMYNVLIGDYASADSISSLDEGPGMAFYGSVIDSYRGDYKNAIENLSRYNDFIDANRIRVSSEDLILQGSDINRHVIDMRSRQLQVENERLRLQKLTLDVDATRNEAEAARLTAESNQMRLEKSRLETQMKTNELEKLEAERKKQAINEQNGNNIRRTVTISLGVLAVLVLIYLLRYARRRRQLSQINRLLTDTGEELITARNEAEQADKMKSQFLADMSHEVRTPLNAIVGFSQILAESGDDLEEEEVADFAARIEENSDLVERIIEDILQLTSFESGHYQLHIKNTNVNEMCREVIDSVKKHYNTNLEIKFTTDVNDGYSMGLDKKSMQQVLESLFDNSMKCTQSGFIELSCSMAKTPGFITFAVTDTGSGIPVEESDKIFERFYKIDTFKQGIGLGLSICKAIADMLNGRIYVDTSYTDGARMVFEIPLAE